MWMEKILPRKSRFLRLSRLMFVPKQSNNLPNTRANCNSSTAAAAAAAAAAEPGFTCLAPDGQRTNPATSDACRSMMFFIERGGVGADLTSEFFPLDRYRSVVSSCSGGSSVHHRRRHHYHHRHSAQQLKRPTAAAAPSAAGEVLTSAAATFVRDGVGSRRSRRVPIVHLSAFVDDRLGPTIDACIRPFDVASVRRRQPIDAGLLSSSHHHHHHHGQQQQQQQQQGQQQR